MTASRIFFIALAAIIAVVGLFAAAWADDYLHGFGLGLTAFGLFFIATTVKRHFDEQETH